MFTWFTNRSGLEPIDHRSSHDVASFLALGGVPTFRQSLPRIASELDRARRYKRAVTFAIFNVDRLPNPVPASDHGADGATDALRPVVLACLLREAMRETDIVTYATTQGRCVTVMPEVDASDARQAVGRLHDLAAGKLGAPVRAGIAVFPQDGLTLEELIRCAGERVQRAVPVPHLLESDGDGAVLSFR